jgi:CheY-like chemotaxis protein
MAAGKVVLVVDDDHTIQRFVVGVLRSMGLKARTASDGVEALQQVVSGPVDLILLDFVMPRMNGYHFCKSLDDKGLAEGVPVVLLSSTEDRVADRLRQHTRVVDFLPKPVKAGPLKEAVRRQLAEAPPEAPPAAAAEQDEDAAFDLAFDLDGGDEDATPSGQAAPTGDAAATAEGLEPVAEPPAPEPAAVRSEPLAALRERLHGALVERLDRLAGCRDAEQLQAVVAEAVAAAVDDALLAELIDAGRS